MLRIIILTLLSFLFLFSTKAQKINYEDSINLYFKKGSFTKATFFGELMLKEIKEKSYSNDTLLCKANSDLAYFYSFLEKYEIADSFYKVGLYHAEKAYGVKHYQYATILNNYGKLKIKTASFTDAKLFIKKAIAISLENKKSKINNHLVFLNDLGMFYIAIEDYIAAEKEFLEVLKENKERKLPKDVNYINTVNNLGVVYYRMGNYPDAEEKFEQVLENYIKNYDLNHPYTAIAINNLSILYISTKNLKKADSLLLITLGIKEKQFGKQSDEYATSLNTLAKVQSDKGNFIEAEKMYLEVLTIRKNLIGVEHPNYIVTIGDMAELYFRMQKDSMAIVHFTAAIENTKKNIGSENLAYINLSNQLAMACLVMNKNATANDLIKKNLFLETELLKRNLDVLSEKEMLLYTKSREPFFLLPFSIIAQKSSSELIQTAYNSRLFFKGISLLNTRFIFQQLEKSPDTVLQFFWKNYKTTKYLLNKLLALPVVKRTASIDSLTDLCNQQEKELVQKSAAYKELKSKLNYDWKSIAKKLQLGEAAVEFIKFDTPKRNTNQQTEYHYGAIVLRYADSIPLFVKLAREDVLIESIKKFPYKTYSTDTPVTVGSKRSLYRLLWQPLHSILKQSNTNTIYFSPDGILHTLSFAAIPTDDNKLLCQKYKLVQLLSTRDIIEKDTAVILPSLVQLFGGINYTFRGNDTSKTPIQDPFAYVYQQCRGADSDSFKYLPNTLIEVKEIKKIVKSNRKDADYYSSTTATESMFRKLSVNNTPDVLHFATHGFSLNQSDKNKKANTFKFSDNPLLRCGLVLSGGNRGWKGETGFYEDDGILTGLEIAATPLPNTKLVVLSACETAGGEIRGSEGVFGLQRAFKLAGVEYVMASLWKVPDRETREFMNYFYDFWFAGNSIENAFHLTQQKMRKKHPPYYWAAFTLVR